MDTDDSKEGMDAVGSGVPVTDARLLPLPHAAVARFDVRDIVAGECDSAMSSEAPKFSEPEGGTATDDPLDVGGIGAIWPLRTPRSSLISSEEKR